VLATGRTPAAPPYCPGRTGPHDAEGAARLVTVTPPPPPSRSRRADGRAQQAQLERRPRDRPIPSPRATTGIGPALVLVAVLKALALVQALAPAAGAVAACSSTVPATMEPTNLWPRRGPNFTVFANATDAPPSVSGDAMGAALAADTTGALAHRWQLDAGRGPWSEWSRCDAPPATSVAAASEPDGQGTWHRWQRGSSDGSTWTPVPP